MKSSPSIPWTAAVEIRLAFSRMLVLTLFIATFAVSSFAGGNLFWVGTGANAGVGAGGNWDNTTINWSTTASGSPSVAWGPNNGTNAVFGGADATTVYLVNVTTAVKNPLSLQFNASGYTLSNNASQTITFSGTGSGAAPNIQVASGKTATIGTNITVASAVTTIWGNINGTAGGELDIANGGTLSPGGATAGLVGGAGTLTSVKTGGKITVNSATTTFILGGSVAGDNCTLSVDGGSVSFLGSTTVKVGGNGAAVAEAGTLTVNSGSFTMLSGNTTQPMTLGPNANNLGTNNLNGGVESVNKIIQGFGSGYINFNGGTLQAVNGAFASTFLNGLTAANVRDGGAVIDINGFNLTIGQALLHSTIAGDSATDGGLVVTNSGSAGSLTLTNANTYNGYTVVSAGSLVLSSSGSISNTAGIVVAGDATFDVSALASFTLTSGQTLSNSTSTATLRGNVNASVGTVALTYDWGTPSFAMTNGTLTLSSNTTFNIDNTSPALTAGSYKLVATNAGGLVTGTLPSVTVNGSEIASGATAVLQITNGELYLVVTGGTFGITSGDADIAIEAFNSAFLTIYGSGGNSAAYITALNDTTRDYFWSQAADIEVMEDACERTQSAAHKALVNKLCTTFLVNWAPPWTWNSWNDDIARVSEMLARGYLATGTTNFLTQAKYGFDLVYDRGWDTNFNNGGIWEQQGVANPQKEFLSTGNAGIAAALIYKCGGGSIYLTKSTNIYNWVRTNIYNPSTGAVYTGVYTNGTVNMGVQVYNQGTFIDWANYLYEITGDSMYFNDANLAVQYTQGHLTSGSVITSCAGQFPRGMGHFVGHNNLWSTYYSWMLKNANTGWANRWTDLDIAWNKFATPTPHTNTLSPLQCVGIVGLLQFLPANQPGFVACTNQLNGTMIGSAPAGGNTIANVFDGNLASYFYAASSSGAWVGLDLGTSNVIGQISYCPRPSNTTLMVGGIFQGDNNAQFATPVTLFTITTYPPENMLTPQTITNQTAFRYVRYVGPANSHCNVAELQFFAANPTPIVFTLQQSNGVMQLGWSGDGMLLEATNLNGPWITNAGAVSPYQVVPTGPQKFFRVQGQ